MLTENVHEYNFYVYLAKVGNEKEVHKKKTNKFPKK